MSTRNYQPLQMHRMAWSDLTEAQVSQALRPAAGGPTAKTALSSELAGKRLKIVTDAGGPTLEYNFRSAHELELSENGGKAVKSGYGALQDRNLVLVSHMIPGTQRGYNLVVDQQSRLATVFEVSFSGYAQQEKAVAAAAKREPQFKSGQPFTIRAKNTGGQAHMVVIWKITEEQLPMRAIEATDVLPPGTEKIVNSITLDPGEEGDITVKKGLQPGRYMLTCFLTDVTTPDMIPHYDRGMLTEFRVQ